MLQKVEIRERVTQAERQPCQVDSSPDGLLVGPEWPVRAVQLKLAQSWEGRDRLLEGLRFAGPHHRVRLPAATDVHAKHLQAGDGREATAMCQ